MVDEADPTTVEVPAQFASEICNAGQSEASAGCALTPNEERVLAGRGNQGLYPPFYYAFMRLFASPDLNRSILTMRLFNVALAAGLVGGLLLLLRGWPRRLAVYTLAAGAGSTVAFIIPSINPSSWAIPGVATAFLGFNGYLVAPPGCRRRALGALALAASLIACAARSDSGAYLAVGLFALALLHRRNLLAEPRLAIVPAAAVVVGLIDLVSFSQSGTALGGGWKQADVEDPGQLLAANLIDLPVLLAGIWGGGPMGALGQFDTPMPTLSAAFSTAVFAALAFTGLRRLSWAKAVGLAAVVVAAAVPSLRILQMAGATVGGYVQPRYLIPLVLIFAGLAMTDGRSTIRLSLPQTALVYGALVVSQALSFHWFIRRQVAGSAHWMLNLSSHVEWWRAQGPGPMATWLTGSLGFAVAALALFAVARGRATPRRAG